MAGPPGAEIPTPGARTPRSFRRANRPRKDRGVSSSGGEDPRERLEAGVVLESSGGIYRVRLEEGEEVEAFLRGRLKRESRTGDRVVAGDRVALSPRKDDGWTIEAVEERSSQLVRSALGGRRPRVLAANLDRVVAVLSALDPPLQREAADRFLVLAESCGLPALLVVNKLDLEGADDVVEAEAGVFAHVGYPVVLTSARSGRGLDDLRHALAGQVSALVGPSGVGKSSLLNALDPELELRTAEVSRRARRGRHTTVNARLLRVGTDAWVVDTPGLSDVSAWGVSPAELAEAFPEFGWPEEPCRFRGCTHTHEPGCTVRGAVEEGEIDRRRYESYCRLLEEASSSAPP